MYKLIIENKVYKELQRIPDKFLARIDQAILSLAENPRPIKSLKLSGVDGYRLRVGNYRIIYTIDDNQKTLTIYRVKSRKDVYR